MSHSACRLLRQVEWRHARPEDIFRHACHRLVDSNWKRHSIQDTLDVDTWRDLDQGEALGLEPEDSTLRDVENFLVALSRLLAGERQMLDLRDKFFTLAFE